MQFEIEERALLTEAQYHSMRQFLSHTGTLERQEDQETVYLSGEQDLRLQKNTQGAKVCLKKGALHETQREEMEVPFAKHHYEEMLGLFEALGYQVEITWLRYREVFSWRGFSVMLDHTRGFGYVIELEKIASEETKDSVQEELREKMKELGTAPTPKHVFDERFAHYRRNWRSLINSSPDAR